MNSELGHLIDKIIDEAPEMISFVMQKNIRISTSGTVGSNRKNY
jgi:hypothetical protein